ncbi:MAG: adenylate/guanylate cyclase domain-containing protein [Cyanobacteria bacterium CRU_2_1]|nr:adenylate/guanylate cyclase domain-containing protein [Cyanobacteria bacterium RU_5_0]NJR59973.1 adenylate/guanylate cyclase domain-containing protein [Cyanobacteria bacterium CRU_2_1]
MVTAQSVPHLILRTESGNRFLSLVGGNCWTVGRGDDNNFVLPDRWISRNHAMLQRMETGEFYLIDLGSRNGSFVNGRRVSVPVTLQNCDRLTFGQTELEFYAPDIDQAADSSIGGDSQEFTATATLHVRRLISVLVVDIRNFTVMTRQIDEKVLSEVIGTWFRCAGDIIREYGSWVDKYIGDAVMAVWIHGAQGVSYEEMIRITRALNALHKMTSKLHERYPLPFPLRIGAGLNTGYAMVGNTGTGDRPDYTALGDTVNAAFRLESSTKQIGMDVALGETTYQYLSESGVGNLFKQHTVNLKGYDVPTITYAGSFTDLEVFLESVGNP